MPSTANGSPEPVTLDLWSSIATDPATPGTPAPIRRSASRRHRAVAVLRCPADPTHGPLVESTSGRLYCPSQEHDGRPARSVRGYAPPTPCYFTLDAAEAAQAQEV